MASTSSSRWSSFFNTDQTAASQSTGWFSWFGGGGNTAAAPSVVDDIKTDLADSSSDRRSSSYNSFLNVDYVKPNAPASTEDVNSENLIEGRYLGTVSLPEETRSEIPSDFTAEPKTELAALSRFEFSTDDSTLAVVKFDKSAGLEEVAQALDDFLQLPRTEKLRISGYGRRVQKRLFELIGAFGLSTSASSKNSMLVKKKHIEPDDVKIQWLLEEDLEEFEPFGRRRQVTFKRRPSSLSVRSEDDFFGGIHAGAQVYHFGWTSEDHGNWDSLNGEEGRWKHRRHGYVGSDPSTSSY